ncbi:hypothetical protein M0R72_19440 [Candidatus Pacearchaeota archaeon]|jgi:hypothetical protein|nr:hypothetical protein [Candidatus Pacearchaeota archaeon]
MTNKNTGKFLGVEDGMMKIEYVATVCENGEFVKTKQVFEYPYNHPVLKCRDTRFNFGPDKVRGWPYDAMPEVGQEVVYEGPEPDMAGHLMVYVWPAEKFSAIYDGEVKREPGRISGDMRKYVLLQDVVGEHNSRTHAWVPFFEGVPGERIEFIGFVLEDGHIQRAV